MNGRTRFDSRRSDSVIAGELLLEALRPFRQRLAGRLLDLGCGGRSAAAPLELAVDGYVGSTGPAARNSASIRADAASLPFALDVRSAVVAEVLEHVRAPDAVMREVFRVANPGRRCW